MGTWVKCIFCLLLVSLSVLASEEESKNEYWRENQSHDVFYFGADVSTWSDHVDYNMVVEGGSPILNRLYLTADLLNLHIMSDKDREDSDSTARITGMSSLVSLFFLPFVMSGNESENTMFGVLALMNPTLEYYFWEGFTTLSVGVGYKTDWFAFSPGHEFYFRPHADVNLNVFIVRISASYAYVVKDTYDLKKGSRFYLRIYLGNWY